MNNPDHYTFRTKDGRPLERRKLEDCEGKITFRFHWRDLMAKIRHIEIEHDGAVYSYNPATGQWLIRYEEHSGHYGWDRLKPTGTDYFGRSVPEEAKAIVRELLGKNK